MLLLMGWSATKLLMGFQLGAAHGGDGTVVKVAGGQNISAALQTYKAKLLV
jgi:hypothetical protein